MGKKKVKFCSFQEDDDGTHKHKPRDNSLGVTWCIRCGKLFNKPCGIPLEEEFRNPRLKELEREKNEEDQE